MQWGQLGWALAIIATIYFGWEYAAIDEQGNSTYFKPSDIWIWMVHKWDDLLEFLGFCLAYVSSFLTCLKMNRVLHMVHNQVEPIVNFITSPYYFFKGYMDVAVLYEHPYIVGAGTCLLMIILFILNMKFDLYGKLFKPILFRIFGNRKMRYDDDSDDGDDNDNEPVMPATQVRVTRGVAKKRN